VLYPGENPGIFFGPVLGWMPFTQGGGGGGKGKKNLEKKGGKGKEKEIQFPPALQLTVTCPFGNKLLTPKGGGEKVHKKGKKKKGGRRRPRPAFYLDGTQYTKNLERKERKKKNGGE